MAPPSVLIAALAFAPAPPAVAGYAAPPSEVAPPPAPVAAAAAFGGRRLLLAFGLLGGAGEDQFGAGGSSGNVTAFGVGAYFRVGEQIDDAWGFGPEVGGGASGSSDFGRAAFTAAYTPADWFTIAAGPAAWIDFTSQRECALFGGAGGTFGGTFGGSCSPQTAEAAGGTLRLDFQLGVRRTGRARRALIVGLVGDLGATFGNDAAGPVIPGFAWGLYVAVGYGWY